MLVPICSTTRDDISETYERNGLVKFNNEEQLLEHQSYYYDDDDDENVSGVTIQMKLLFLELSFSF